MAYYYKTGVIVPFVQKFYKQMIVVVAALFIASMASMTFSANAATPSVVYDNIATPQPGNVVSLGYEATSTSEFGGQIMLAGTSRNDPKVTVLMSSWGCENGSWNIGDCATTPGAYFSHPITLNIYAVGASNAPGTLLTTKTQTFDIPYRPSADNVNCTAGNVGKWYDGASCFNGLATPINFDLTGFTIPDNVIISIAYNTTHFGYAPIGESATCYLESGGCGYDSLNVGFLTSLSTGSQPLPADAYINSTWTGAYCNGSAGSFRLDTGCWSGYQPSFRIEASPMDSETPTNFSMTYNERPGDDAVANGGSTDSFMFTFNLSATGDPVRYQLKYWNDIVGSPFKVGSPWNPSDLAGYSPVLGTYNDQFTQGEGKHYFSFSACDAANNCSAFSDPFVVTYDITAPAIPIDLSMVEDVAGDSIPDNGYTNSYSVTTSWGSVVDASYYEYGYWNDIDGNPYKEASKYVASPVGTSVFGVFNQGEGVHHVVARSVDAAGNVSGWSEAFTVTYDATNPGVDITNPTNGAVLSGSINFAGTVTDTNNASHQFVIKNAANTVVGGDLAAVPNTTSPVANATYLFNSILVNDGTYTVVLIGTDSAGRTGSDTITFKLDNFVSNKEECKNGGWTRGLFNGRQFRNQGDCVSNFASTTQLLSNPDGNRNPNGLRVR